MIEVEYMGKIIRIYGYKIVGDYVVSHYGNGHSIRIPLEEWEKLPKRHI